MWLVCIGAHATMAVGFVIFVIAFEENGLRVSFIGQDMGGDPAIVPGRAYRIA